MKSLIIERKGRDGRQKVRSKLNKKDRAEDANTTLATSHDGALGSRQILLPRRASGLARWRRKTGSRVQRELAVEQPSRRTACAHASTPSLVLLYPPVESSVSLSSHPYSFYQACL